MTQRTAVLYIEPLAQANSMEEVTASRYLSRIHFLKISKCVRLYYYILKEKDYHNWWAHLITDGAYIIKGLQLSRSRFRQCWYLVDRRAPLHEHRPASACLAPDIEVGMNAHHDRPDGAACSILGYQVIVIDTQNQPNNKITCTRNKKAGQEHAQLTRWTYIMIRDLRKY